MNIIVICVIVLLELLIKTKIICVQHNKTYSK